MTDERVLVARSEPQDEPAAAPGGRPRRARRGAAERPGRLRRHRPRTARAAGEGRALRGSGVRHHRAGDGLRRPAHTSLVATGAARSARAGHAHEPGSGAHRRASRRRPCSQGRDGRPAAWSTRARPGRSRPAELQSRSRNSAWLGEHLEGPREAHRGRRPRGLRADA